MFFNHSELDIKNAAPSDYDKVVKACLAVSKCISITSWGVSDAVRLHFTSSVCSKLSTYICRTHGDHQTPPSFSTRTTNQSQLILRLPTIYPEHHRMGAGETRAIIGKSYVDSTGSETHVYSSSPNPVYLYEACFELKN